MLLHSTPQHLPTRRYILAGMCALIVVHGLGRFAFTPLLPYLVQDGIISLQQGASLASLNYLGYLMGALCAVFLTQPQRLKPILSAALILNVISTALQMYFDGALSFALLRLINGLSNGLVFVLAPALILEWLVEQQKIHLSGLVYLGVSIGLIIDSILVDWCAALFSGAMRWLPITLLALPLMLFSVLTFRQIHIDPIQRQQPSSRLMDRHTTPLFIAYAGAGLGYILPMTFLPALAHQVAVDSVFIIHNTWLITAIACLCGLPFWNHLGTQKGDRYALIGSYAVQACSVLAVLLMPNAIGIVLCAILMGSSFMGTVVCSQRLAKTFQPHQGAKLFATLISIYAGTQLLGPYLAKLYMQQGGSLLHSFAFGLMALIWGMLWMFKVPKPPH